jgi:dolichol-phosphate mannosyltransferase
MNVELSVVLPCFNEANCISVIVERLKTVVKDVGINSEIIFIDDGSNDGTWEEIKRVVMSQGDINFEIKGFRLAQNKGQQIALLAGLSKANGEYIISMDADGQHAPELIPDFWNLRTEFAVITGVQKSVRRNPIKRLFPTAFYLLMQIISPYQIKPHAGDFRLISRSVKDEILGKANKKSVIRFLIAELGYSQKYIFYFPDPRMFGDPGYSTSKRLKLGLNAVLQSDFLIMRFPALLSVIATVSTVFFMLFVLANFFLGENIPGWTSIMVFMGVFASLNFATLGVMGIVIMNLSESVSRPMQFRFIDKTDTRKLL